MKCCALSCGSYRVTQHSAVNFCQYGPTRFLNSHLLWFSKPIFYIKFTSRNLQLRVTKKEIPLYSTYGPTLLGFVDIIYLPSLFERKKWKEEKPNLSIEDVVMIIHPNLPRGHWQIGNIVKVYPGDGGLVRVLQVQKESGTYDRGALRPSRLLIGKGRDYSSWSKLNSQPDPEADEDAKLPLFKFARFSD